MKLLFPAFLHRPNSTTFIAPRHIFRPAKPSVKVQQDSIHLCANVSYLTLENLMKKIVGINSIEDTKKIETLADEILRLSADNERKSISEHESKNNAALEALVQSSSIKTQDIKGEIRYIDDFSSVSEKAKKEFKRLDIDIQAVKRAKVKSNQIDPVLYDPVVSDWLKNLSYRSHIPNVFMSMHTHPIDKAKYLTGMHTVEDKARVEKKARMLLAGKTDIKKISQAKYKILREMQTFFTSDEFVTLGQLKSSDLAKLKKLTLKYEIFEKVLGNKSVSKQVEAVVFNSAKRLSSAKIGDYISDLGVVINRVEIYDKKEKRNIPCVITFDKLNNGQGLRLVKIDSEAEDLAQKLSREYEEAVNLDANSDEFSAKVEKLNQGAKLIIDRYNEAIIAKVDFRVASAEALNSFLYKVKDKEKLEVLSPYMRSIQSVQNGETPEVSKITMILGLVNSDPKRYYNAGRTLAMSLMHLLKKNDLKDVFLIAHAMGKEANSPLPLYLRAGFKPIYPSEEVIHKQINDQIRWEAKRTVYMYLPQDALINQAVEETEPLSTLFNKK